MQDLSGARLDVMLLISDLGSGGAQRVVCALAEHWAGTGRRVVVTTLSAAEKDFVRLPAGVDRYSIGLDTASRTVVSGLLNNMRRVWRLRRLLRKTRPAVAVGFVGPTAALLVAAAAGTGIRTVAAERNDPARQSFGTVWDRLRNWAYRRADYVTANSRGALESLKGLVPAGRLAFTPNPMPQATEGPRADLVRPTLLAVGRLHRQKGIDVLLEAFARAGLPEWRLVLVGEGGERESLARQAEALGIAGRVRFEGAVPDPAPWYRAADIFVLPSRHEGTPNSLLEAMAYGLPVVVSNASQGPLDLVADGVSGIVTPAEDVAALAAALLRLAGSQELRARLGDAARRTASERQAHDDAFARWDAVIDFTAAGEGR